MCHDHLASAICSADVLHVPRHDVCMFERDHVSVACIYDISLTNSSATACVLN